MSGETFVLILPPSREVLSARLAGRGSESEESFRRRLAKAEWEIETAKRSGVYNHEIINDDLETAVQAVVRIVNQERPKK
jgi:guanylate kinase